jgi:hypothetical protein
LNYKEWIGINGLLHKEWRNEAGSLHREDGPAQINYYRDGSIEWEEFHIAGKIHRKSGPAQICYHPDGSIDWVFFYVSGEYLGRNKRGFWALWDRLDEEGRQAQDILKYLARYS